MVVSLRRSLGTVIVLALAGIAPPLARADLESFKSALLFKNKTGDFTDNLELFIPNGKFVSIGPAVTVNPPLPSNSVKITDFTVPKGQTLTLNVAFQGYDGTGFSAKWTKGPQVTGTIAMLDTTVDVEDLGGGILEPQVVIGNENPGDTLTFSNGGYAWVSSFFDVFVDPLPPLIPLPNEVLDSGDSFTFSGLARGTAGEQLLLVGNVTDSSGGTDYTFDSAYPTPEPPASALLTSILLTIAVLMRKKLFPSNSA